jgi:hypothetical protein
MNQLKLPWILFFLLLLNFVFFTSGNIDTGDAKTNMYLAKQIILKGKIDFGNDPIIIKKEVLTAINNPYNKYYYSVYNFGYALFLVPGVLLSFFIRNLFNFSQSTFPYQYDWIYQLYANLFNASVISLIGVILYKVLTNKKILQPSFKTVIIICATIISTDLFVQGHQQFAHPLFTLILLLAYIVFKDYLKTASNQNLLYFTLATTLLAATYNFTFLLVDAAFIGCYMITKRFKHISWIFFLSFLPGIIIQLSWNYLRFGNWFAFGYTQMGILLIRLSLSDFVFRFLALTIGFNKGLLFNNPLLILGYWQAIKSLLKKRTPLFLLAHFYLILTVIYIFSYCLTVFWHGESAYGPRFFTPLIPFGIIFALDYLRKSKFQYKFILFVLTLLVGIIIQLPGVLIPHFTFPFISKPLCTKEINRYFNPQCAPFIVGWAQLVKREVIETKIVFASAKSKTIILDKYPNPLRPFQTIYPDPFFDKFSVYKTNKYKANDDLINCIYAFTVDIWWIKIWHYKNLFI